MDDQKPWQRLVITLVTVALMVWAVWMEAPEWQREMAARQVRARLHRVAAAAARRSGRRAMGDELHGRPKEADAGYAFTFRLSSLRDRF